MNTRTLVSCSSLCLLALLGCGGPEPGNSQDRPAAADEPLVRVDACGLLTKDEVESALGKPVGEPRQSEQDYSEDNLTTVCNWDAGGILDGVSLTVRQPGPGGTRRTSEEYARSAAEEHARQKADPEQAPYLTDIQFSPLDMSPDAAVVMDWGDYVVIQVYRNGTPEVQILVSAPTAQMAETLARAAATRSH